MHFERRAAVFEVVTLIDDAKGQLARFAHDRQPHAEAISGVMSLNRIPGFGKSGISRISFLISSLVISICAAARRPGFNPEDPSAGGRQRLAGCFQQPAPSLLSLPRRER